VLGIFAFVWIAAMTTFDYQSAFEPFAAYPEILNPLMEDRKAMLLNDLMRSLGFIVVLFVICRFALIEKRKRFIVPIVALVILVDLWSFGRNYVNSEDFANKSVMQRPFQATAADRAIFKDTTRYRVLNHVWEWHMLALLIFTIRLAAIMVPNHIVCRHYTIIILAKP